MATTADTSAINNRPLTKTDFTTNAKVMAYINEVKAAFPAEKPFIISDVLDAEGHQYVHLVQKGGGVLGIALVGYTYVLEQMGIRFLRLAGTSAGAINTAMMTVIGKKEETKSEAIVEALCGLDFFGLVDGHPAARWVIRKFVKEPDFFTMAKKWVLAIIGILALLVIASFISFGLQHTMPWATIITRILFVVMGVYVLLLGIAAAYISSLLGKLKESGFGINPGDYLYDWIKARFTENGVKTVSDLNAKASADVPGIRLRDGIESEVGTNNLKGDVTFITSELVTQNKIQFPAMCDLFREAGKVDTLQPAGFVRASMSIPVFFESYYINNIPCTDPGVKSRWQEEFGEVDPPETARFVDGGILSNFPINLFFNKDIKVPRLPTFGIDLDDSKPDDNTKHAASWSFGGYLGRMFNTIRFYYDKDFLLKNKVMQQGVGKVPLSEFNWLNFFLTNTEKIDMFIAGAEAAKAFLLTFDWQGL